MDVRAKSRGRLMWGVKVLGSLTFLTLLFYLVPFAQVWEVGRRLPLHLWLLGFALFLGGHAVAAFKWSILIDARLPFSRIFRAHLAGLGANLALPGVAGGDLVRAGLVMNDVPDRARLAAGSVADRLIDTLGLALIAVAGGWALWADSLTSSGVIWRLLLLVLPVAAVMLIAAPLSRRWMPIPVEGHGKPIRILLGLANQCSAIVAEPGRLIACLVISLFVQCLFIQINIMLADATDVVVSGAGWYFAWSSAKILAILPISLGGLGVREASMAALLKPFGADPGHVIAVGLLWQTILYCSGILGLIVQTLGAGIGRSNARRQAQSSQGAGQ